jgi:subtilisin family serine protease
MALDQGATVINMSLGTYSDSAVVRQAVELALSQGVMVVAAAGNEGVQGLTYPAAYPGVIAVSAVDARGEHAEYANTDPNVDIAAPGVGIYAAWEDDALVSFSGTSAAAPFVAGTLAMLLGGDAAVGTDEALDLIRDYANDNGAPGPDAEYGAGTLNVGRILQRDQPGIIDAAISSHYIDAQTQTDTVIPLLVSAQNRGTENIPNLEVVVSSNGKTTVHTFTNVLVGETVSVELPISTTELQDQQAIDLETFIRIPGLSVDAVPENDARSSRIHLTGDSSTQQ